jgi:predicted RNase H-like HicB family nuclease
MAEVATSKEASTRYAVVLTPDPESGGYTVTVPSLPGVFTHGDTVEEALSMARDAIACFLELPEGAGAVSEDRVEAIMATVAVANS